MTDMTKHYAEDFLHQTTTTRPRPFVLYSQVSTKVQVKGISLDAQQHMLNSYVDQTGGVILDVFQDVASAYGPKASTRRSLLTMA
jgi:DNA invertase Pin-like site-specific DNA recombinase